MLKYQFALKRSPLTVLGLCNEWVRNPLLKFTRFGQCESTMTKQNDNVRMFRHNDNDLH